MIYIDDSILIYIGTGVKEENYIERIYMQFANHWDSGAQPTLSQCGIWLSVTILLQGISHLAPQLPSRMGPGRLLCGYQSKHQKGGQ